MDLSLAAARRRVVAVALGRLGVAGEPAPPVQGVRITGDGAAAITDYGALVRRVGEDAARYALVRTRRSRPVLVDLDIWSRRDERNPAWRVQWIGPRTADVLATAAAYGLHPGEGPGGRTGADDQACERLGAVLDAVPDVRAAAARYAEPHRLADHLERAVVPAHDAVVDLVRREVSAMRDDRTGNSETAYRASLFLLARCVADVADVLAVSGLRLPDRL